MVGTAFGSNRFTVIKVWLPWAGEVACAGTRTNKGLGMAAASEKHVPSQR